MKKLELYYITARIGENLIFDLKPVIILHRLYSRYNDMYYLTVSCMFVRVHKRPSKLYNFTDNTVFVSKSSRRRSHRRSFVFIYFIFFLFILYTL